MTVVVRRAGAAELPGILDLWQAADAEPTATDDLDSVRALVAHDPEALLVATVDGRLAGTVIAAFDGWRGSVYRLAVAPVDRRRGVANALLAAAEARFDALRVVRRQAFTVSSETGAMAFWEATDWTRQHDRTRFVATADMTPPPSPHPVASIPAGLVAKVMARRGGRLHAFDPLESARTALVAIDLDADSVGRDPAAGAVVSVVNRLASAVRAGGGTVAWVTSRPRPTTLRATLGDDLAASYEAASAPGGPATRLSPDLDPDPADVHAVKTGASAFFPTTSDLRLPDGVRSVLIVGLVTNVCCESSARDAHEAGYEVTLVADALAGHAWGLHEATLSTWFRSFGDVRVADEVVAMLSGRD